MYTLHYGHLAFKDLWAELKLPRLYFLFDLDESHGA